MEFDDNDPFPLCLPSFEEPRIFDEDMTDGMGEGPFGFSSMAYDSSSNLNWDDSNHPSFQSPASSKSKVSHPTTRTTMLDTSFSNSSTSPESSLQDSSSDSSNNHQRNHSLDSTRSGAVGGDEDTPMANGILIGADPVDDQASDKPSPATDVDLSNRAMERHFDFDSAASSPSQYQDTKAPFKPSSIKPIKMPYRSSPNVGFHHGYGPYSGVSSGSREASPLANMMKNQGSWPPATGHTHSLSTDFAGNYVNGAMLSGPPPTPNWPYSGVSTDANAPPGFEPATFQSQALAIPFASPTPASGVSYRPTLHVHQLPPKSRVETQIPVKLTLNSMPPGITKLHLQTYTISKSKLVTKPPPEKSPGMLELYAMLVCTSAMQDPAKQGRAFTRAAEFEPSIKKEERGSLSSDGMSSEEEEDKPLNGGPVNICMGCIERERKRAARKKTKNVEEEQLWQKDEAKRTIVFNTHEVKEWQQPCSPKIGDANTQSSSSYAESPLFPENAMQVDIPMRIACYCRHQEEKIGFQVIFTIKDHQHNIIAQTITNSIVITDDHKTHATPSTVPTPNPVFPDNTQVPGAGVFSQTPTITHGPASFRHAYSTTDLQGMQQQSSAQQIGPFAMPQDSSQTTSATLTPKHLSRQASPSAPSGQHSKKRKASTSGRIRSDLTMTKLQTPAAPTAPTTGVSSAGQSVGTGPGGIPAFVHNYASPHGLQMPSQFNTNPPTPSTTDGSFFSSAQRSQSMENLQAFPGMFSAPSSVRPSRVPSPTSGPQSNGLPQTHAQMLANSLHSVPGAINPQRSPVIHKLTPGEGPKSGGIEVTCLGSGFSQGLEVMFGDAQATTTTFWGESALVCLVPPAVQAGTVPVTFKHNYEQNIPSPPTKQAFFKYIDDDEQELMKHALTLLCRKFNGSSNDPGDSARHIIHSLGSGASFMSGLNQGSNQQRQMPASNAAIMGTPDLEAVLLSCLELVDLDDGPHQASLNARGRNGQSMLHLSASLGFYRFAAGLLARGANPDLRDNNGLSPMHMASLRGQLRIIGKLRSAGGDPTLRSLNGYIPADMAISQQVRDASNAFDHHTRSRSAGATPASQSSRASSVMSFKSSQRPHSRASSTGRRTDLFRDDSGDEGLAEAYKSQPVTPAQMWARSRRNSLVTDQKYPADTSDQDLAPTVSLFAANPAMSAWRDQISAQIQQLQQSVHRTLPNLQIPAFPPIPNLPDYQAYPVVRRISSLVPQRGSRPSTANGSSAAAKEAEYHWWELLTGPASPPPAYEEIYPKSTQQDLADKRASVLRAAGEAFVDKKCEENFDQARSSSIMETVDFGSPSLTRQQREQLRNAHALKVKKLRNDRNFFFIWIPVLVLVILTMVTDRAPQLLYGARQAFHYIRGYFQDRLVEVA